MPHPARQQEERTGCSLIVCGGGWPPGPIRSALSVDSRCFCRQKADNAAAEFCRLEAQGRSMVRTGDYPELFGTCSGGINCLRVTAGQGFVPFVAYQENGEGTFGDGRLRRDAGGRKARERC